MTKILLILFMNYSLIFQIIHGQFNNRDWPKVAPTLATKSQKSSPTAPSPVPPNASKFERITPKCYPETATAYFLPAPPSSPKITVLDPNLKDFPSCLDKNEREKPLNFFKEVSATMIFPPPSVSRRAAAVPPPPPCLTGLQDLIDEIPFKTQERISRLADTEEKAPVCKSCAALLKSPIFNFDQELLDGFFAGIGI